MVALLPIVFVSLGGCGPLVIDYHASTVPSPAPTASVALRVTNERDVARGGRTERVGTLYDAAWGGAAPGPIYYFGKPLNASRAETVTDTVRAATTDALAHAGISVRPGGAMLTSSVKEFWMDGHQLKTGVVIVGYELTNRSGRVVWNAEVRGEASVLATLGDSLARMFRAALQDLAQHACNAFRSREFQIALGGG